VQNLSGCSQARISEDVALRLRLMLNCSTSLGITTVVGTPSSHRVAINEEQGACCGWPEKLPPPDTKDAEDALLKSAAISCAWRPQMAGPVGQHIAHRKPSACNRSKGECCWRTTALPAETRLSQPLHSPSTGAACPLHTPGLA
jgi:hypothetical protein